MAELATLARPYAEALFKSVSITDAQSTVTQLSEAAQVAADEALRSFADNPRVSVDQVFGIVSTATKTQLGERVKNLLRVVIENGRLAALPEISAQFQHLVNARSGSSDATIYSAFAIEGDALAEVVAMLEKRFDRKLKARVEIVPELIGGIRVVVGDEVLDTSVKARLEQMKVALTA
ncbi:ATP synthase subunit delta [Rubrivivax sp. A210]|uniref:F0F1 ATP synthase subunit delta n=1 Tax=Rubrivivax sp. A210 TaxID=2772301 RepID=UPI001917DA3A|nr:F0F1 ATP synthase subunit delta [Rubrivivax sp. A210]CAD5370177.1 ATP synthase subunit delta [Rubrivivax sp. A210]